MTVPLTGRVYESADGHRYQCLYVGSRSDKHNEKLIVYRDLLELDNILICSIKYWNSLIKVRR